MTSIKFRKQNNFICEMQICGHADYSVDGEDIVCAGISCISQTAVLGLLNVAKINAKIVRKENEGLLRVEIPQSISEAQRQKCSTIMETCLLGLSDLQSGYSDFIELEVIDDVY